MIHDKQTSPAEIKRINGARGEKMISPTFPSQMLLGSGKREIKRNSTDALGRSPVTESSD